MNFESIDDDHIQIADEVDEPIAVDIMTVQRVKRAMDLLPDGYRTVFTLYLLEGYDHQEIGEILSISEATSKSQYSRAKKKIRQLLEEVA